MTHYQLRKPVVYEKHTSSAIFAIGVLCFRCVCKQFSVAVKWINWKVCLCIYRWNASLLSSYPNALFIIYALQWATQKCMTYAFIIVCSKISELESKKKSSKKTERESLDKAWEVNFWGKVQLQNKVRILIKCILNIVEIKNHRQNEKH